MDTKYKSQVRCQVRCWEDAAEQPETEKVRGRYLTQLFLTPILKGLNIIQQPLKHQKPLKQLKPLKLLKVDLWNEGIDLERNILKHLIHKNQLLYGIDISYKACSLAKENTKSLHISQGTIEAMAFKNSCFNMLLDLSTLDHLPPEHVEGIIQEYNRVLKKEGVFILVFDWWGLIWRMYICYLNKVRGHGDYFFKNTAIPSRYIHPIARIKKLLVTNGFNIKGEYCIDYTGWMWNRVTKPLWMMLPWKAYELLIALEYSSWSKYLKLFAKQYVIIAQKTSDGDEGSE